MKKFLGKLPIPAWLFAVVTVAYCEALLHLWTMESFRFGRFAAVVLFAVGFGGLIGQVFTFLGQKTWGKWVCTGVMALVTVLYIVEYFCNDAYMAFMQLGTIFGGAKGVATDFADIVLGLVFRGLWRIVLFFLPVIGYGLFAAPRETGWRLRWFALVAALAAYVLGFAVVWGVGTDADRLSSSYNFDSAIHCFGLNMGVFADFTHNGTSKDAQGEFVIEAPVEASTQPTTVQETQPAETEPIAYEPNVMDFDFAQLAATEKNSRVASIHKYVNSVQPTMKNEYTGLFKGKNLIIITAEAFSKEVIDPVRTPTLYRLANEGICFEDYYQPMWGGSTSSGEFSVLSGLVSASGTNSIKEGRQQDMFLSIGKQLQKEGYFSAAYHDHLYTFYDRDKTHTYYGYDTFMGLHNGMEEGVDEVWPESDLQMMDFTVPKYINNQPFSIYYMTVSGHCRYNYLGNKMSKKNYDKVKDMDCSETVKCYLASQLELEYAMESLVRQLEEAGIADDTLIVLTADHYPYGLEPGSAWDNPKDYVAELYGYDPKSEIQRDHNALIMWSGCLEGKNIKISSPTYSLDILPTISNLFGVDYDSRLLVGRDVFSDAEPIVLWYDYSWVTEKGTYNSETRKFTPAPGVEVDNTYVERIKNIVQNKVLYSREVQNVDYFNYLAKAMKES